MIVKRHKSTKELVEQVKDEAQEEIDKDLAIINRKIDFDKTLVTTTGSTLLDLAISGKRKKGGGIPGGILVEFFGPSGAGKTALLAECSGSVQIRGGEVRFRDPEARLDQAYSQIYGVNVAEDFFDYSRPDTVEEMMSDLFNWEPTNPDVLNVFCSDSIAALSTEMEMESEDKMGMKRAKEFSTWLRQCCRKISKENKLVLFTNQIRQSTTGGTTTPGGMGVPFYASLRIKVDYAFPHKKIKDKITFNKKEVEKIIGINSMCSVEKSSVDEPYRTAPVRIIFNYGIDDIGANLQYCKDMLSETSYDCSTKTFQALSGAIKYVEEKELEEWLKEKTIDIWEQIEAKFTEKQHRKPKVR